MTTATKKLQRKFKSLATSQKQTASQLNSKSTADLNTDNAAFDRRPAAFRSELAEAYAQLPDGRSLLKLVYEALVSLAKQNEISDIGPLAHLSQHRIINTAPLGNFSDLNSLSIWQNSACLWLNPLTWTWQRLITRLGDKGVTII